MAVMILLIILVPITFAVVSILGNVDNISAHVSSLSSLSLSAPPDWVSSIPVAGGKIAGRWREFAALSAEERTAVVLHYARTVMQWFMAQAGSIGMTIVQFLLTVIVAAVMYSTGEQAGAWILAFMRRLAGPRGEVVTILAEKSIRSVALGIVVTAAIQTVLSGVGLAVVGVPGASVWTIAILVAR